MIPKEIIEKAIEGGFYWKEGSNKIIPLKENGLYSVSFEGLGRLDLVREEQFILDPLFWQSLGKALGWMNSDGTPAAKYINNDPKRTQTDIDKWYAHQFLDLLLTGGDTEKFWKDLLAD